MNLKVPDAFLRSCFVNLFYSILPRCTIWGRDSVVILEPITIFSLEGDRISEWKSVEELVGGAFDFPEIRSLLKSAVDATDGSDLEQILIPIRRDVYLLHDNPLSYPGERLAAIVQELLPSNPEASAQIDGVFHVHPTGDSNPSGLDRDTMRRLMSIMETYDKDRLVALIIALKELPEYIRLSRGSETEFVEYAMNMVDDTSLKAQVFHASGEERAERVSII